MGLWFRTHLESWISACLSRLNLLLIFFFPLLLNISKTTNLLCFYRKEFLWLKYVTDCCDLPHFVVSSPNFLGNLWIQGFHPTADSTVELSEWPARQSRTLMYIDITFHVHWLLHLYVYINIFFLAHQLIYFEYACLREAPLEKHEIFLLHAFQVARFTNKHIFLPIVTSKFTISPIVFY